MLEFEVKVSQFDAEKMITTCQQNDMGGFIWSELGLLKPAFAGTSYFWAGGHESIQAIYFFGMNQFSLFFLY